MKILVWLILCVVWGSTWFFIKTGLADLPPITFASARFIVAVIVVFGIIILKKIPLPDTKKQWKLLALTGFLQFSLNYSCVFWSEQYISSGLAAVLQATIPAFGLIAAWIHLPNERITGLKIAAICIGIIGVAIIFAEQLQVNSLLGFIGCLAIVLGAAAAAEASVLTKAFGSEIHPASLVFGQMLCGIPPMILYSLLTEGNPLKFHWSNSTVATVFYLAIVGTILTFWLYYWLLKKIESTKAMMISLITPLIAVIVGSLMLGEKLPLTTFIGGSLILSSVGLVVFKRKTLSAKLHEENTK
jgi:drug/metabolite transporter (DMT)-like permease